MPSSLIGIVHEDYTSRLLANYRTTSVAWEGAPFTEPTPTASGSAPTDWIVPRVLRLESSPLNTENDQLQDARIAVWLAFQPERADKLGRRDAIATDLADAFSLARSTGANVFTERYDFVPATAPQGFANLANPWEWEAMFFDATYTEQP